MAVVGLGAELVSAWLVARGLLLSPSMLKSFGLGGFAVQLLGYRLEIDNHQPGRASIIWTALSPC